MVNPPDDHPPVVEEIEPSYEIVESRRYPGYFHIVVDGHNRWTLDTLVTCQQRLLRAITRSDV